MPDRNSMLIWWPRVQAAREVVPMPRTLFIPADRFELARVLDGGTPPQAFMDQLRDACRNIGGYPVFMRTDLSSGKHSYDHSCFVRAEELLDGNVFRLVEENEMAGFLGLPYEAFVIREFIRLEWAFKAFSGRLPIARERRYFVNDGKMLCHHAYWAEEAVASGVRDLSGAWQIELEALNREDEREIGILTRYAEILASTLDGAWSLDFAERALHDGAGWYFIDAATAADSWHPSDCPTVDGGLR